ncbi:MAG: hypothetical protein JRE28_09420 [Deltaproteobacteria bacterium]|nr:hypothetical protein [Deltaproteobacteria bacterium]
MSIQHVVWRKVRQVAALNPLLPDPVKQQFSLAVDPKLANFGRSCTADLAIRSQPLTVLQGYTIKQLDAKEIKDLYELRMALEIYVVERLAETGISERKRKQLAYNWRSVLGKRLMTEEELSALDQSFHESLAVEMDNQVSLIAYIFIKYQYTL